MKTPEFAGVAGMLAGNLKIPNRLKSIYLPELPDMPGTLRARPCEKKNYSRALRQKKYLRETDFYIRHSGNSGKKIKINELQEIETPAQLRHNSGKQSGNERVG